MPVEEINAGHGLGTEILLPEEFFLHFSRCSLTLMDKTVSNSSATSRSNILLISRLKGFTFYLLVVKQKQTNKSTELQHRY